MTHELLVLLFTASSIAFIHTILGPDHYLPFIVMSRAGKWSRIKTIWITVLCGIGHVGSSVALGIVGIVFGVAVMHLQWVESFRGDIAGWGLIAFGVAYGAWGFRNAMKNKPHHHSHAHSDGILHAHDHSHHEEHAHAHVEEQPSMTPWILFTVFVFGPCEPLIPIIMYPAARNHYGDVVIVSIVFGAVTIATMLSVVLASSAGLSLLPVGRLERYSHAFAGLTIALCGGAIQFLGL